MSRTGQDRLAHAIAEALEEARDHLPSPEGISMTRKHFEALANALAMARPFLVEGVRRKQWEADVEAVARVCHSVNANFDIERFVAACRDRF